MTRTRSQRTLSGFLVLGAVPTLIWASAPSLVAQVPPPRVVPRFSLAPQIQAFPNRPPVARIDPRFVVEPAMIDPGFIVARSADIDPKFVVNRSADIDPWIVASRPAEFKRR